MWLTHLLLAALPIAVQHHTAGTGMAMVSASCKHAMHRMLTALQMQPESPTKMTSSAYLQCG